MSSDHIIRKAVTKDVPQIQLLVNEHAKTGNMLALSLSEIYEQLRDFYVFEKDGQVAGVCALHISWEDLAEIRSLAVRDDIMRRGFGRRLVQACLEESKSLGIRKVFALTYRADFFKGIGFKPVKKADLPQKVWRDCLKCVKFPNCDEEAYMIEIDGEKG